MREKRNAQKILVGKLKRKRPLGIPRHRWKDNIEMDLKQDEVVWTGFVWLRVGIGGGLL
jgi:hypothetical protein